MPRAKRPELFVHATRVLATHRGGGDEDVLLDWTLVENGRRIDRGVLDWPDFDVWVYEREREGTLTNRAITGYLEEHLPSWRDEFAAPGFGEYHVSITDKRRA